MNYLNDSIQLLRGMVAIPSPTFEEDAVCSMILAWLQDRGVGCERVGNNIIAANLEAGQGAPVVLLDAHIDTVAPAASYTRDPYDAGSDPDRVWGLGSNDDGGSVVAMVALYRRCLEESLPCNLILVLSCEEERSGDGGTAFLYGPDGPFAAGKYPIPDYAIIGEPTGNRAATSERGLIVIDALASGVSGHAARNEGVNALYIALEDIERLRSHRFERVSELMGEVHLNVTQIQAGTAHNVIPDSCSFVIDVRPTDCYDNAEILSELQAFCKSSLVPRRLSNRSSATPSGSALAGAVVRAGIETFSSPTTSDWIRVPYPAVKLGPGESSRSHKADEFIMVSEIEAAVETYYKLIKELIR